MDSRLRPTVPSVVTRAPCRAASASTSGGVAYTSKRIAPVESRRSVPVSSWTPISSSWSAFARVSPVPTTVQRCFIVGASGTGVPLMCRILSSTARVSPGSATIRLMYGARRSMGTVAGITPRSTSREAG